MNEIVKEYEEIIQPFVDGKISSKAFGKIFSEKFLNEKRSYGDELFHALDWLFAEALLTTDNPELLKGDHSDYISETRLKDSAAKTLREIRALK